MGSRGRQIAGNALAFALLFAVSAYRQLSLRLFPHDPFRTYVLYACYVVLCAAWAASLVQRVTQREMRAFLLGEDACMLTGLTIRFVQDTFLADDIALLRTTGLLLPALLLPMYLLGLYAALCIGEADGHRIDHRWYLLWAPTTLAMAFVMTDDLHHLVTYIVPEEPQPNLSFHPAVGTYLFAALVSAVVAYRVAVIYRKNPLMRDRPVLRFILPFMESILLLVFYTPYTINWLQTNAPLAPPEVIEQYAKLYYIEAVTWEVFIYVGLVPVNTNYRELFEASTLGLQILGSDGTAMRSRNAASLTAQTLERLRGSEGVVEQGDRQLSLERVPGGELVWAKDVSELNATLEALQQVSATLAQKGELLAEELHAKGRETRTAAQNLIYDALTTEVGRQLDMMDALCRTPAPYEDLEKNLRKLVQLGTYVKRRCDLRLTELQDESTQTGGLEVALRDMMDAARLMEVRPRLSWNAHRRFPPSFCVATLDQLQAIMEACELAPESLAVEVCDECVTIVAPVRKGMGTLPSPIASEAADIEAWTADGHWHVRLWGVARRV